MLTELKVEPVLRKKRFRGRRNPKQRKFRKKRQKKFQMQCGRQNQGFSDRISISYGESFWLNYSKAIQWTTGHIETYWKLQAHRLQRENALLRNRLQSLTNYRVGDEESVSVEDDGFCTEECNIEDATDATTDFEVTEEFMQFIEASLKHKSSRKKKKKTDAGSEDEEDVEGTDGVQEEIFKAPKEDNSMRRCSEMKQLYGRDSAKIQGMETAVHLAFLRKCDKRKPVVWPVVPLAPLHHSTSN